MSIENRYHAARNKFFGENPGALAQIESVKPAVIEACEMTVDEYREQQRIVVFAEAARSRGLEVDEFVIRLVAESPEQAKEWRLDQHRKIADALSIDWDEYKQLNRIIE
ncbi:hypothetical protein ALO82_200140 [Pseudomonas syringae pv. broussonetiae]|uniref:Uncharacterized protein n=1 Tax=Pseudomonas savastanoi TaxID=29438 RepID=A0A3M5J0W5_PSESS|nr:DUF6388 family protein [Pseudomonas savastanoi]KPW64463.1 hypothetical protein ALO82_200140 [Pseudomonas syringae pv. broussonetiae]KWT15424.1 hypothetical protein AL047_08165 [Pseudomonas syringae pv. broussonetiae]RMT16887.1 hypothetical protein ALP51_200055 [Pseudomonas savastanoi]